MTAADAEELDTVLAPVWNYLAPQGSVTQADVIFVFGGHGFEIPKRAAELYHRRVAPTVLLTGASGPLTVGVYPDSEARVFANELIKNNIPSDALLLEECAQNTGENVVLGMAKLRKAQLHPRTVALVSKSFLTRRAMLTFARHFPEVDTIPLPPVGPPSRHLDRSATQLAERMLSELKRLRDYQKLGFIAEVVIPESVVQGELQIQRWLDRRNQKS